MVLNDREIPVKKKPCFDEFQAPVCVPETDIIISRRE